jgi:hypothetical protein
MNRKQRRAQRWFKLSPHGDFEALKSSVSENVVELLMSTIRLLLPDHLSMSDELLWNSLRQLIEAGFLNIYLRLTDEGVEVRPEFLMPSGAVA